jgi:hypothetical protein
MSAEGRRHVFKPPAGRLHLVILTAIGALGLVMGLLLRSTGIVLIFTVLWLVPVGIIAIWRRSFVREVSINPDHSLNILLYSGSTQRIVSAEGLSHELKRMGRMQYLEVTGVSGTVLRVGIFQPGDINAARDFFGRAV